jgi:hypothetical protein
VTGVKGQYVTAPHRPRFHRKEGTPCLRSPSLTPQPVAPIQRRDPTDPFQATSRSPASPGPNLHVHDPAYLRACLREYNVGQMQNVRNENADGLNPISYSHLRVIRAVIDRTMDDAEVNNHIRDLAIMLITHRVEQCIREQRESPGYPAFPPRPARHDPARTVSTSRAPHHHLLRGEPPDRWVASSPTRRPSAPLQSLRSRPEWGATWAAPTNMRAALCFVGSGGDARRAVLGRRLP